jgi:uncharacterized protein (TIGR02300 family)
VKHPNYTKDQTVAKPELGTKRLCASCGAKFYDLNKDPIHCPKCGTVYEVAPVVTRGGRPDAAAAAARPVPEEAVAAEVPEVETVSLEEADAEASGAAAKKPATGDVDVAEDDVEIEEALDDDDDTFIEEQEEEDADVTDIIGGDIENEEEG